VERIRENMFFVVTGVIVILCLAFYFNPFLSVYSWEGKNQALDEQLKKLENRLKAWADEKIAMRDGKTIEGVVVGEDAASLTIETSKGDMMKVARADIKKRDSKKFVPNASALKAADDYHAGYASKFQGGTDASGQPVEGVKDLFSKMVLSTKLPGLQPAEQETPQVFLKTYNDAVKALVQEVKDHKIKNGPNSWAFWDWGNGIPDSKDQREEAAREYWLTSEILEVVQLKQLNVVALDRLEGDPGSEKSDRFVPGTRVWQRRGEYFDAIPFNLEVKMRFQGLPELIAKLLTTKTPVDIENISISRLSDEQRAGVKGWGDSSWVVVNVKLGCLALNYRPQGPAPTGPAGPTPPTGPGPRRTGR
jgi:hypothetical protein